MHSNHSCFRTAPPPHLPPLLLHHLASSPLFFIFFFFSFLFFYPTFLSFLGMFLTARLVSFLFFFLFLLSFLLLVTVLLEGTSIVIKCCCFMCVQRVGRLNKRPPKKVDVDRMTNCEPISYTTTTVNRHSLTSQVSAAHRDWFVHPTPNPPAPPPPLFFFFFFFFSFFFFLLLFYLEELALS